MKKINLILLVLSALLSFAACDLNVFQRLDELSEEVKDLKSDTLFTFALLDDDTYAVIGVQTSYTDLVIPATYHGKKVTRISQTAFRCAEITSITLGENITTIEKSAFADCSALKNVIISSSVSSIAYNAFARCWNLENVTFNDTTTCMFETKSRF